MVEELVKKKVELLTLQKSKVDQIYALLNGPGGFNEHSRKTLKNLDAAITASKRPGYFSYYEPPDHVKATIRSGEVERLRDQVMQLQRQIDQLTEKIDREQNALDSAHTPSPAKKKTTLPNSHGSSSPSSSVHSMKQWFAEYGSPKQASGDLYSNFTPDKKIYGGTAHHSAFRSQASTMKKGRLTK